MDIYFRLLFIKPSVSALHNAEGRNLIGRAFSTLFSENLVEILMTYEYLSRRRVTIRSQHRAPSNHRNASPTQTQVAADRSAPLCVKGTTALNFDAGTFHTCTVRMDGKVMCWGYNNEGQLATGPPLAPLPLKSRASTARSVATGGYESCAVLSDGKVKCWGDNTNGGLGDGTATNRSTPVEVSGITTATQVIGYDHSCALLSDGKVKCWGLNEVGQLGTGPPLTALPRRGIGHHDSDAHGCRRRSSCALLSDGKVKC